METSVSVFVMDGAVIIKSWNRHEEEARRRGQTLKRRAIPHRDKKAIRDHVRDNLERIADSDARARAKDNLSNPDYILGSNGTIVERNPSDSRDQRDTGVFPEGLPKHVNDALRNARFIQDADRWRFPALVPLLYLPVADLDPSGRLWSVVLESWRTLMTMLPVEEDMPEGKHTTFADPDFKVEVSAKIDSDGTHRLEARIELV